MTPTTDPHPSTAWRELRRLATEATPPLLTAPDPYDETAYAAWLATSEAHEWRLAMSRAELARRELDGLLSPDVIIGLLDEIERLDPDRDARKGEPCSYPSCACADDAICQVAFDKADAIRLNAEKMDAIEARLAADSRLQAAEARIEELTKGLEPFARLGELIERYDAFGLTERGQTSRSSLLTSVAPAPSSQESREMGGKLTKAVALIVDLATVKPGDELIVRLRVREIGLDGKVWCDNPFHETRGAYGAFSPTPAIIEHRAALSQTKGGEQ